MKTLIRNCFVYGMILSISGLSFTGCGRDLPFQYEYTSPDDVRINYLGTTYALNKNRHSQAPFDYAFEPDGDVDIVIDGVEYEIESPYDSSGSLLKSKKKKAPKKRSTKRRRR